MTRRLTITACTIVLIAVVLFPLIIFYIGISADPLFNNRRLSTILSDAYKPAGPAWVPPGRDEVQRAVETLGARAVPLLQSWLSANNSSIMLKFYEWAAAHWRVPLPVDKPAAACQASMDWGTNGCVMIIPLLAMLTNQNAWLACHSGKSLEVLCGQAQRTQPANEQLLKSLLAVQAELESQGLNSFSIGERFPRSTALSALRQAIRNYDPGASLQNLMKVRAGDRAWRHSARVLSRQQQFPELIIPRLERDLANSDPAIVENALLGLRNYGPSAIHCRSEIEPFLTHSNQSVRAAAREALQRLSSSN